MAIVICHNCGYDVDDLARCPKCGVENPHPVTYHPNRRVIDTRPDVRAEPKLLVELSGDEKDVIIQCRCGDRISLVKLLGIEAVKPIFDGISGRIRGLIENMKPEALPRRM